jgi:hypothetical protein
MPGEIAPELAGHRRKCEHTTVSMSGDDGEHGGSPARRCVEPAAHVASVGGARARVGLL